MSEQNLGAAVALVLTALEARRPVLSAAALEHFSTEAAQLKANLFIKPDGFEAVTTITDHTDGPVALIWSAEHRAYGYFSERQGWVSVPPHEIESFSVDIHRILSALTANLSLRPSKPPVTVIADHLWDLGSARLPGRMKRTPILFARRLDNPSISQLVETSLANRPTPERQVLLTSTASASISFSSTSCLVISIRDLLLQDFAIDPAVIVARLDGTPILDLDAPLVVLADGKEVRFQGETFHFARGVKQRQVVRLLHKRYLAGVLWTSSDEIAEELELSSGTRIRDLFKKHPAWNRLLTERNGMCGFCFD
jgi:hypothetical protein